MHRLIVYIGTAVIAVEPSEDTYKEKKKCNLATCQACE